MTILNIEIPDGAENAIRDLVENLGGKVISKSTTNKLNKTEKRRRILTDLEESVKWVKLYQHGKVKAKSIKELLKEL